MLFKGSLWGDKFPFTEGPSHAVLFQLLAPNVDHDSSPMAGFSFGPRKEPIGEVMLNDREMFHMLAANAITFLLRH